MIKLEQIQYRYKKKLALNIEQLEIHEGDKIAFLGLNGAGKTTLVELIIGLKNNYKGTLSRDKQYTYNAVFQDASFIGDVKLKDIFYMYCDLYKTKKDHKLFFEEFGILDIQNNYYKKVSGGQQQKFKFLISLLNEPNFLVLDEIATSLDYVWRHKILDVIKKQLDQKPDNILLLVSHDPEEVAKICNRVIELRQGEIVQDFPLVGDENQRLEKIKEMVVNRNV